MDTSSFYSVHPTCKLLSIHAILPYTATYILVHPLGNNVQICKQINNLKAKSFTAIEFNVLGKQLVTVWVHINNFSEKIYKSKTDWLKLHSLWEANPFGTRTSWYLWFYLSEWSHQELIYLSIHQQDRSTNVYKLFICSTKTHHFSALL